MNGFLSKAWNDVMAWVKFPDIKRKKWLQDEQEAKANLFWFSVMAVMVATLYLLWGDALAIPFIFWQRVKKLSLFLLVSIASSWGTVAFQSVVRSRFLTPGTLGVDAYYRLLQTLLVFFGAKAGLGDLPPVPQFAAVTLLMIGSYVLSGRLSTKNWGVDLHTILMVGLVLGTLFNSGATFLHVLLDPNEYDKLQTRLMAGFQNVDLNMLLVATLVTVPALWVLWKKRYILEVLNFGKEQATNLGICPDREIKVILFMVIILSAVPAALTGSMLFLGFATANLTYPLVKTYRMNLLLPASALIGFLLLAGGQFLVEQVFAFQTSVSILVEWFGGILFFVLLWKERSER